jgi:membrane protease YdiL (CAAX protease family)
MLGALLGRLLPESFAGTAVAATFLGATYLLALHPDRPAGPWGLGLGGLLDRGPIDPRRLLGGAFRAAAAGVFALLAVAPAYTVGFVLWHAPAQSFDWGRALFLTTSGLPSLSLLDLALGHLLVVALPEEAFFRGYLQSALDRRSTTWLRLWGARIGPSVLLSSVIFALGHWLSVPDVGRLAVFFPSLLFGWLRAKTGGVGAAIVCHALCNLYVIVLGAGYGLSLG